MGVQTVTPGVIRSGYFLQAKHCHSWFTLHLSAVRGGGGRREFHDNNCNHYNNMLENSRQLLGSQRKRKTVIYLDIRSYVDNIWHILLILIIPVICVCFVFLLMITYSFAFIVRTTALY